MWNVVWWLEVQTNEKKWRRDTEHETVKTEIIAETYKKVESGPDQRKEHFQVPSYMYM